jgi:hypothetical protein
MGPEMLWSRTIPGNSRVVELWSQKKPMQYDAELNVLLTEGFCWRNRSFTKQKSPSSILVPGSNRCRCPPLHGLTGELKSDTSVASWFIAILNVLQQFSAVSTAGAYTTLSRCPCPPRNNYGDSGLVNDLVTILLPDFLSVAECRLSQGNFCWRDWYGVGHHHALTTCFVE